MPKTSAVDAGQDAATRLTLAYLEIIERCLDITYNSQGEPICVHGKITIDALTSLAFELSQLLGDQGREAIDACKLFGEEHIQSIGFGHVSDFDAFVKVGFLYSERVVVWDILSSRVISPGSFGGTSKGVIADIACNLLLLRPVVRMGGIVILPHPLAWSETARKIAEELNLAENKSASSLGLSMALVAIDEGIPLHPFTLATSKARPASSGYEVSEKEDDYTEENHNFGVAATALMGAPEFSFLRHIRIDHFYEITLAHPDLHRVLRKQFASLNGLTPQQSRKEIEAIYTELKQLAVARDTAVSNYKVEGVVATAGLVASAATMVASPAGATMMAILGIAPTVISVTRRWLAHPQKNVIVQAFSALRSARPFTVEFPTAMPRMEEVVPVADADLAQHIEAVMGEHWTEDAHHYLEELPEDTAIRVLDALHPEQMFSLVNYRSRQEDYIGDYLAYVWEASPDAFWRHIEQTFISEEGMLMCDLTDIDDVLTSEDMPVAVWMTLLRFVPAVYAEILIAGTPHRYKEVTGPELVDYQLERLVKVISYQLLESGSMAEKQLAFCLWLSNLDAVARSTVGILLPMIFPLGLPEWLA